MKFTRSNIAIQILVFLIFTIVAFLSYQKNSSDFYKVNEFRKGQYDVSDADSISVRWDVIIKVPPFTGLVELSPYNLSDSSWGNGISRVRPGFFIQNTVLNRMSLSANDTIYFPFSGRRAIASIEHTDSYIENLFRRG